MKRIVSIALIYLLCGTWAGAQAQDRILHESRVRIDFEFNNAALVVDDDFDRLTISTATLGGSFTFQHESGVYGRLGLGRADEYDVDLNGNAFDPDEQYLTRSLGVGYRFPRQIGDGLFWGLGYQNVSTDQDGDDAADTAFAFWEKDNARRYGIIGAGFTSQGDISAVVVEGKHLWFGQGGIGVGLTWLVGSGRLDAPAGFADPTVGAGRFGVVVMFRPSI